MDVPSDRKWMLPAVLHTLLFVTVYANWFVFGPWAPSIAALLLPLSAAWSCWRWIRQRQVEAAIFHDVGFAKDAPSSGVLSWFFDGPMRPRRTFWIVFCGLTVCLCLLCGSLCMMSLSVWCAYPRSYHRALCEETRRVANSLAEYGVRSSLTLGSTLGLVRHGGVIPWEHDSDLLIELPDIRKAITALMNNRVEFQVVRNGTGLYIPVTVDQYYYRRDGEPMVVDVWAEPQHHSDDEFEPVVFCNGHTFLALKDRKSDMATTYGPNFMDPSFDHLEPFCRIYVDA